MRRIAVVSVVVPAAIAVGGLLVFYSSVLDVARRYDSRPAQGSDGGKCRPDGTCDETLVCVDDLCGRRSGMVAPPDTEERSVGSGKAVDAVVPPSTAAPEESAAPGDTVAGGSSEPRHTDPEAPARLGASAAGAFASHPGPTSAGAPPSPAWVPAWEGGGVAEPRGAAAGSVPPPRYGRLSGDTAAGVITVEPIAAACSCTPERGIVVMCVGHNPMSDSDEVQVTARALAEPSADLGTGTSDWIAFEARSDVVFWILATYEGTADCENCAEAVCWISAGKTEYFVGAPSPTPAGRDPESRPETPEE